MHVHNIEKIYIYMSLILQNYLLRCKCISYLPVPITCITFIIFLTTSSHSLIFFSIVCIFLKIRIYISLEISFLYIEKKTTKKKHRYTYICLIYLIFAYGYFQWFSSMSTFNLSAFDGYHPARTVEGDLVSDGKCGKIIIGVRLIFNFLSVFFQRTVYIAFT